MDATTFGTVRSIFLVCFINVASFRPILDRSFGLSVCLINVASFRPILDRSFATIVWVDDTVQSIFLVCLLRQSNINVGSIKYKCVLLNMYVRLEYLRFTTLPIVCHCLLDNFHVCVLFGYILGIQYFDRCLVF